MRYTSARPTDHLLARPEKSGKTETGKWVSDGMVLFLQDVSSDKPLTREHTQATVTVRLSLGCGTYNATEADYECIRLSTISGPEKTDS